MEAGQTPISYSRQDAHDHYRKVAMAASDFSDVIPKAIDFYFDHLEKGHVPVVKKSIFVIKIHPVNMIGYADFMDVVELYTARFNSIHEAREAAVKLIDGRERLAFSIEEL